MNLNIRTWTPPEIASPDQMMRYPVDARGADWRNKDIGTIDLKGANLCRADLRGKFIRLPNGKCGFEASKIR